jgi:hypothetical protein
MVVAGEELRLCYSLSQKIYQLIIYTSIIMSEELFGSALVLQKNGDIALVVPELVSRLKGVQLRHYWKGPTNVWQKGELFASQITSGPAVAENTSISKGRLDLLVREKGDALRHYWLDPADKKWHTGAILGSNVSSMPTMVLANNGNIEVLYREGTQLRHWWGHKDVGGIGDMAWKSGYNLSNVANDVASGPSMIQTTFGGSFEIVYCNKNHQLQVRV